MYREDMKRCPFCGGKAELLYIGKSFHNDCFIKCLKCKVEQGHVYKSKKSAITAWNRRKYDGDVQQG